MQKTTNRIADPGGPGASPQGRPVPDLDDGPQIPDDDELLCLGQVELNGFTADPSTVPPFGDGAQLRWNVTVPSDCSVGLRLNGSPVGRSGTRDVQPAVTTRYTLTAHGRRASRTLGTVDVRVDTGDCRDVTVTESQVRGNVQRAVDDLIGEDDSVSLRNSPKVELTDRGIEVALDLKKRIDNFADPKVDIDFVVDLRIRNGAVEAFYRSFSVDVDWPWWVTTITAGISKIIEEFKDETVEDRFKPLVLRKIQEDIDNLIDLIPGDRRLHSLRTVENRIEATVCPAGQRTPFMVLRSAGDTAASRR